MKTYGKGRKRPLELPQASIAEDGKCDEFTSPDAGKGGIKQLSLGMSLPKARNARPFMSPEANKCIRRPEAVGGGEVLQKSSPIQMYLDFGQVRSRAKVVATTTVRALD